MHVAGMGRRGMHVGYLVGKPKRKSQRGRQDGGLIVLKLILNRMGWYGLN
jgi:hypothetical protein